MCGICGFVRSTPHNPARDARSLKQMCDVIRHRGPDAEGQCTFEDRIFLGHRRLSIIDLSPLANQPLTNEDGSIWIIYNGEVYNYMTFRAQLEAKGHSLRSVGDTEMLVHLYEEMGVSMLDKLNGMFAFALWDARQQLLFCARDAFGIKPFYYTQIEDGIAFGSEIKALLAQPEVQAELDPFAFWQNMSFRYVPGAKTLFKGIYKLLPGHYLIWRPDHGMEIRCWSDRASRQRLSNGHAPTVSDLQDALQDAVRGQLVADVPVGSFLSGGLDSSLVTALMCRSTDPMREVRTYTVGYDDTQLPTRHGVDRVTYIDELAARYPISRQIIPPVIDPNEFLNHELLRKIVWHLEEPVFDSALVNAIRISQTARADGTPVLLCGHGADELFGGYRRHKAATYLDTTRKLPPMALRMAASASQWLPADAYRIKHFLETVSQPAPYDLINISFLNSLENCRTLLRSGFLNGETASEAMAYHLQILDSYCATDLVDASLYLDQWTYLVDQNLLYMDKLSMAHSIESRVPFLDSQVYDLAAKIPSDQLVTRQKLKAILNESAKPLLPASILNRPKSGFGVLHLHEWWQGKKPDWFEDLFHAATDRGWYAPKATHEARMLAESGNARASEMLLSILLSEVWAQCFLENSAVPIAERST